MKKKALKAALLGYAVHFDAMGIDFVMNALIGLGCSLLCLLALGSECFLISAMALIIACFLAKRKDGRNVGK